MGQLRSRGDDPELVARTGTNAGAIVVLRDGLRNTGLSLNGSRELPVGDRRLFKDVARSWLRSEDPRRS